jgi:type I restriction enzyme S subunit
LNGRAFKPTEWSKEGKPIIRIQNLNNPRAAFNYFDGVVRPEQQVESGDLLFAWSGTPGTSFGAHIWDGPSAVLNQHIFKVVVRGECFDKRFLRFALNQRLREFVTKAQGGVGLAHITKGKLEDTLIPLPPYAEQRRIVEKLDELLTSSRAARAALDGTPTLLEQLRQSVLGAACSGNLTRDLRDDTATDDGKPAGWEWARLGDLTSLVTSGSRAWSKYYRVDGRCTFVMAQNVRPMKLDLRVRTRIDPPPRDPERRRTQVHKGDLLITIVGANTGDTCRAPTDLQDHFVCQSVALVRPVSAEKSDFLELWLNSPAHGGGQLEEYAYGQGRPHLSLEQLRSLRVTLPPVREQAVIVERVRRHLENIDSIACSVAAVAKRISLIEEATLARAFRGELVSRDPADAPAATLLGRLRLEGVAAARGRRNTSLARTPA